MNREKVIENAQECYKSLISSRIEIALLNLNNDANYREICLEEERTEQNISLILQKLDKADRSKVHHYIESLTLRVNVELKKSYEQGLRDGVHFIAVTLLE